jgi:hypothetical protein
MSKKLNIEIDLDRLISVAGIETPCDLLVVLGDHLMATARGLNINEIEEGARYGLGLLSDYSDGSEPKIGHLYIDKVSFKEEA